MEMFKALETFKEEKERKDYEDKMALMDEQASRPT